MRSTDDGRAGQKARTRAALLEAARKLMAEGELVTVSSVADLAGISRATAYRYFSEPQTLTIEALLDSRMQSTAAILGDCTDPRERVQRVRRFLFQLTRDSEAQFRQYLARTMELWLDGEGKSAADDPRRTAPADVPRGPRTRSRKARCRCPGAAGHDARGHVRPGKLSSRSRTSVGSTTRLPMPSPRRSPTPFSTASCRAATRREQSSPS